MKLDEVLGPLNLSVGLQPINQSTGKYCVKLTKNLRTRAKPQTKHKLCSMDTSCAGWTFEPAERDKFRTRSYYAIGNQPNRL